MKANNVLLLTGGVRRNDGPDPIHSQGIAIKSDQVGGVRHSNCYFALDPNQQSKSGERGANKGGRPPQSGRNVRMQVLTYVYVFAVWCVGTKLLRVVNRFEPNPLLAAVLQFLILAAGAAAIASRLMR
jgi:hypothetical protein